MRAGVPRWWALLWAVAVVLPRLGFADVRALDEGRKLYKQVEYDKAVTALQRALKGDLAKRDRLEALLLLARCYRALDRPGDVVAVFRKMLELDPSVALSSAREPPNLVAIFQRVQRDFARKAVRLPVRVKHEPVKSGYAGLGVTIRAQLENILPEHKATVHFRRIGQVRYDRAPLVHRAGNEYVANIRGAAVGALDGDYLVEYHITVVDVLGETVASVATPEKPLRFRMVAPIRRPGGSDGKVSGGTPWYKRWYIWVAIGVVIGGGVGAGLALK